MTILVHLSDTHFGTEMPEVVRAVERALLRIQPHIVTITGDLTQRARASQFRATKTFLDALPADLKFVIPGNHDIPLFNLPLRMLDPYSDYTSVFGLREGVWCHDRIGIIGLNATSRWRHTRGALFEQDVIAHITRARSQLQPDALLVVCAHQPLVVALPEDRENILVDADKIAHLFAKHGVDLVLSGHVHMPLITTTRENFPTLTRHFVLSGAGTAVSHRIRSGAPNSFNVIRLERMGDEASITIDLMEYDAEGEFVVTQRSGFKLGVSGWEPASA
jgi:3',5'-cyclic AMP phosphodiesterase CpdA